MQYGAELHESDGYNAFDVTRGYINIQAMVDGGAVPAPSGGGS